MTCNDTQSAEKAAEIACKLTAAAIQAGKLSGTADETSKYFAEVFSNVREIIGLPREVIFSWINEGQELN